MIALFILLCVIGLVAGYQGAAVLVSLNQQRFMNSIRQDVGFPTKPYRLTTRHY